MNVVFKANLETFIGNCSVNNVAYFLRLLLSIGLRSGFPGGLTLCLQSLVNLKWILVE